MNRYDDDTLKSELTWLFNYADGDLGISSNWMPMVQAAIMPSGMWNDTMSDGMLIKISKRREIEKAFYMLNPQHQDALFAVHGAMSPPHSINKVFQALGPMALCSRIIPAEELITLCDRMIRGKLSDKEKSIISKVRMEAMRLNKASLEAYKQARYENSKRSINEE